MVGKILGTNNKISNVYATLEALRDWYPRGRIITIFQPHTYTRTKALFEDFSRAFGKSDIVFMTDIYASAREKVQKDITSKQLVEKMHAYQKNVLYTPNLPRVKEIQMRKIFGEKLHVHISLANFTTFKIGGPADYFIEARTSSDLEDILSKAILNNIPFFILGGGSNILIGDKGIRGLVIKNNTQAITIRGAKGRFVRGTQSGIVYVEVDTGVMMNKLVRFTIDEGLQGLEMHLGLPGTVGGALYMNSKWMHPEGYVGDSVYQATLVASDGSLRTVPRNHFHFGYDKSSLQQTKEIVTRVVFALKKSPKDQLWDIANKSIAYRRVTQPQGVCSPGCTFRNITKAEALSFPTPNQTTSAGMLLDKAGVKGYTIGGAQVSPIHANFIINVNHARAVDVIQLIEYAREKVKRMFGITLQEEIVHIGEF